MPHRPIRKIGKQVKSCVGYQTFPQLLGAGLPGIATSGRAPSLEQAKSDFQRNLNAYKVWYAR
jgi:hypothetical protein